jgi:hypothetical protein
MFFFGKRWMLFVPLFYMYNSTKLKKGFNSDW